MFNDSKYTTWYYNIVNFAINKCRIRHKRSHINYQYYEAHHIIPKSLGGTNEKSNIVLLTPKEHYICHLLLIKMLDDRDSILKMMYAINITINTNYKNSTSKLYATIRQAVANELSARMKGVPKSKASVDAMVKTKTANGTLNHSEETKEKMRMSHRTRPPQSTETKEKRSVTMSGRTQTLEHRIALSAVRKGRTAWNKGLTLQDPAMINCVGRLVSNETRDKLSKSLKGKPKSDDHLRQMSENAKLQWAERKRITTL